MSYADLQERVWGVCQAEGWEKDWANGGCYLHLEASELIEALRGKTESPVSEGGDVLFTLLALLANYDINIDDCAKALIEKMDQKGQ